jgi:peroxiredoxin
MRKGWIVTPCIALSLLAGAALAGESGLSLGDAAPMARTALENVDGKTATIAGVAGKNGTLVVFTCNSCPWVKAWQSRMVEIANTYAARDVGVIMINSNDPDVSAEDGFKEMVARSKKLGMKFPYVVDATSDVARAFGATRTPEAFLFDAKGKLVYHGTIDDNAHEPEEVSRHYLADALDAMVGGKRIEMAETKALGCSIKFRAAAAAPATSKKGQS